jgi:hypothetical protein
MDRADRDDHREAAEQPSGLPADPPHGQEEQRGHRDVNRRHRRDAAAEAVVRRLV